MCRRHECGEPHDSFLTKRLGPGQVKRCLIRLKLLFPMAHGIMHRLPGNMEMRRDFRER